MKSRKYSKKYSPYGEFKDIWYDDWGDPDSKEVIVCVHGLSRNAGDFTFLAREIQDRYRLICIDVIGRGRSSRLDDIEAMAGLYNNEQYATDIRELLENLGVSDFNWLGTSMGGSIGMLLATASNSPIKKLILNDIGPFVSFEAMTKVAGSLVNAKTAFSSFGDARKALKKRYTGFGRLSKGQWTEITSYSTEKFSDGKFVLNYDSRLTVGLKAFYELATSDDPSKVELAKASFKKNTTDVLVGLWSDIDQPVLTLRGANSEVVTAADAKRMVDPARRRAVKTVKGAGHAPMFQNSTQVEQLLSWLRSGD